MLSVAAAVHGQTTVLYVDDDAPAGGSGATWQDAFSDLQDALAVVNSAPGSYEVRIAEGVYTPDRGTGDQASSFHAGMSYPVSAVSLDLTLTGGFAGVRSPSPDTRDPEGHPTVLSGDLENDDPSDASGDDNSFCVVTIYGFSGGVALDGLVVTGGYARENGMFNRAAGLAVHATEMFSQPTTSITMSACRVFGNRSDHYASAAGASLQARFVTVSRSRIEGNTSTDSHRMGCGGLFIGGAWEPAFVVDCVIDGNSGGSAGGAFANRPLEVRRSSFSRNVSASNGGGLYAVDGLHLENCLVADNASSNLGGGIYVEGYWVDIMNSTIASNQARYGGGAFIDGHRVSVINTIAWGNSVEVAGAAFVFSEGLAQVTVRNSQIDGGQSALYGSWSSLEWESNIETDPLFRDPLSSAPDYRLIQASPGVDVADPTMIVDELDLDGLARRAGNTRPMPLPDIGCYELQTAGCLADFNGDGYTDGLDIDGFTNAFDLGDIRADLNRDGYVDGIDYDGFYDSFRVGC